jgi:hypothetical protein
MIGAKDRSRFESKVNVDGPVPPHRPELGPCHVWMGALPPPGYGRFRLGGKHESPHRVAFLVEHGRWPTPWCLHHCDNPACVNPAHLFEGTPAQNTADMLAKRRNSPPRGERCATAKLTEQDVRDIFACCRSGRVSQRELARRYGVKQQAISKIARRQRWAHILTGESK